MQGFNMGKYVPPDQEGVLSGNQVHNKHALGTRASKLPQGVLTVRFEMPFAVWCDHCRPAAIIGQGVRFNAAKRRVGAYHTTAVWAFRMRHPACGGDIEIRTDPAKRDYVVTEGGRRRDTGEDGDSLVPSSTAGFIATTQEREAARQSAFGRLEKTIADRARLADVRQRIDELQEVAYRQWEDPYMRNQRLRKAFRVGRHAREMEAADAEHLKDRMSLAIDLLPGTEEDARRAALVDYGRGTDGWEGPVDRILAQPLFGAAVAPLPKVIDEGATTTRKGHLRPEAIGAHTRGSLVSEIVGNSRAATDPFLDFGNREGLKGPARLPRLKRKRPPDERGTPVVGLHAKRSTTSGLLVGYTSESD